ncbi:MAG: CAP domain-containing protein [Oscillatoria sp. PMC 1051.18]|nr:CAP domain-containing protein [Oscillatoria sp. PMC 1050.18]MEC5030096.1 CAP domain-containing protein [Oscillatoria sp. PMC 1051.18]
MNFKGRILTSISVTFGLLSLLPLEAKSSVQEIQYSSPLTVAQRNNCNAEQEEERALAYLNYARQNPQKIGKELGINISNAIPQPPLTMNPILRQVARERVLDMATRNYFDHVDPDGIGPNQKVAQAGYPLPSFFLDNPANNFIESLWTFWVIGNARNVSSSGRDAIATLIVDENVFPPGHRIHLLALNDFYKEHSEVGIGYLCRRNGQKMQYFLVVLTAYPETNTSSNRNSVPQQRIEQPSRNRPSSPPTTTAANNLCGSNFVSEPTIRTDSYDRSPYRVWFDFRRGQEEPNFSACGRQYWLKDDSSHYYYGIPFVYLVNGEGQCVVPFLYRETENGTLEVVRAAPECSTVYANPSERQSDSNYTVPPNNSRPQSNSEELW